MIVIFVTVIILLSIYILRLLLNFLTKNEVSFKVLIAASPQTAF